MLCKIKKLSFASAAIFAEQADGPTYGAEQPVPVRFRAISPVFFSRREREPEKIGGSSNQTAPHAHSKQGTFEEGWWRVTGGGQPLASLFCETSCYSIRLHCRSNLVRQPGLEQIRCKEQPDVKYAFRSHDSRRIGNALPIDTRLPRHQSGNVRNPHQALPKVFGSVDADQHEFIFHGQCRRLAAIQRNTDLARKKILKWKPARKIAQRDVVVQLDDEFRIRLREKILARNFPGVDGAKPAGGYEVCCTHQFRGTANIPLANKQVPVAVPAQRRVAISAHR